MSEKVRIGFVGVGGMGQAAHLRNYAVVPDCEVVAIAELRPKLGDAVARKYNIGKVYRSAADMLAAEKLDGIGRFFDRYPDKVPDLVFIQIAPPSRSDLGSYQQIRAELERKTGQINGARSRIDLVPIRYVNQGHSAAELYGVYRACKIALVTPLRDGMNLVAKEYVAAQDPEDPGVLILSRFAGAAFQLTDAVLVNHYSADDISHAIRIALDMPLEERKKRWKKLHRGVKGETVQRWMNRFLKDVNAIPA